MESLQRKIATHLAIMVGLIVLTGLEQRLAPLVAPKNLARSIALELAEQPALSLPLAERFEGAGIYALYYTGPFEPYAPIVVLQAPIYVGKAVPKGGRKASSVLTSMLLQVACCLAA